MKNLFTKLAAVYWTTWLLIAGGIFLLVMAFRSCNNLPSHKDEKKGLDSLATAYEVQVGKQQRQITALTVENDSLQKRLDSANMQLAIVRKDAAARVIAVQQTLASGDQAALHRDTAAIIVNWDSLRAQVIAGLPVVIAQDSLSHQVIDDCMRQGVVKDSLITVYRGLWMLADTNYARQLQAYNGLFVDYTKANSRLKFNKTLSRGLAIALLAAGAKIFVFK